MPDEKKNPFGLTDEEVDSNIDCLQDSIECEVSDDEPDFGYMSDIFEEIEALGGDPFSMF